MQTMYELMIIRPRNRAMKAPFLAVNEAVQLRVMQVDVDEASVSKYKDYECIKVNCHFKQKLKAMSMCKQSYFSRYDDS